MKEFIGQKRILAKAMKRGEYNEYRGWTLPEDEDGADEGFLVEYLDGGATNHDGHEGYVSWSPKDVFEASYQSTDEMDFSAALRCVKDKQRVARAAVKPPLAVPSDVKIGKKVIIIIWNDNDDGLPKAAADAMRSAELNFDNPAPDTDDLQVVISTGGRPVPRIKAIYKRMNREEYDAAVLALKPAE